ncbi:MAG: sugar kinase, partial [Rhodobacteraceae bacterium]|nr:sugar kinase [Paracoccaceae bacterium]MCH1468671.1 sugar kinase [Paracoccaceae bacterium]
EGIIAASCIIDFECVMVEGWLPEDIRARIVAGVNAKLQGVVAPGIDLPTARAGTIGSDARALGGASLPLSDRFLIDRHGFVNH